MTSAVSLWRCGRSRQRPGEERKRTSPISLTSLSSGHYTRQSSSQGPALPSVAATTMREVEVTRVGVQGREVREDARMREIGIGEAIERIVTEGLIVDDVIMRYSEPSNKL